MPTLELQGHPFRDRREVPHVVVFGKTNEAVKKVLHLRSKKQAVDVANGIAYVLWHQHPFKMGDPYKRIDDLGYWITIELTNPPEKDQHHDSD